MKIRIRGNSIRYRLTMTEVETFSRNGYYEEDTLFTTGKFGYALKAVKGIKTLTATFANNTITLKVPDGDAREWAANAIIGFSHDMDLPDGGKLSLLLEKDFACLDDIGEDQSDNYPNPKAQN